MRLKITMGIAALALGTALASGTAFAQSFHYPTGKAANDGGYAGPSAPSSRDGSAAGASALYNVVPQQQPSFHHTTGRAANDGGIIQ
jgi:hypothetical protein